MNRVSLLLACLLSLTSLVSAGENLLRDGGFEQVLDKPDDYGNPFKVWAGWKWEGNCKRVADTDIKHSGKSSALMLSYGACKTAIQDTVKTEAGFYRLSGYVRAINLRPGMFDKSITVSFEPKGKELMTDLPGGTYGWRRFEVVRKFDEPYDKNLLYVYLFGSGRVWLDDLVLEKLDGVNAKEGLTLAEAEETLKGFVGAGGMKCPGCGLMVDPQAEKCGVCGESSKGLGEYAGALKLYEQMAASIEQAKGKGVDVLYWQAAAIPMRVGLNERWNNFPEERNETLAYVNRRAPEVIAEITEVLTGKREARRAPPKPDFTKMKLKGRNFVEGEQPRFIFSMHSGPAREAEPFFSSHTTWVYTCMAPGADRFNYKEQPIWGAFNKYPDTHRVWDGGWCGHIIADKWSGGVTGADIVICLESPHTRDACVRFYQKTLPGQMKSKTRLVSLLDYEYYYLCYCDVTRDMFRGWLKDKFGTVEKLNAAWDTSHKGFADVSLPEYKRREPNDAKRYDFLEFNIWRFTEFMRWAKAEQRKIDPDIPMATCAPHYNFTHEWGESGSDVESMANAVNDFCINESPASTKYVDFLRSISDNKKAIVEVEGSEYRNTMASFLHGLSALSLYWGWSDRAGDGGAMLYGRGTRPPYCSVAEVERFLRTALDVRRLEKEIVAFQDISSPVALLYSKASMLQVPAGTGDKTPYLLELEHCYDAMLELGLPVDFITSKQVLDGKLGKYKVLVVPAATYEHAAVVEQILAFARGGGQVVLVPNCWFFDQHNRKQPFLPSLGVTVTSMKGPIITAGRTQTGIQRDVAGQETEAPFLMGLIVDTVVTDVPKARIVTAGSGLLNGGEMALQGAGVRHVAKVSDAGKVLGRFEDGQPAIVEIPAGQGAVYYLAIPLVHDSMAGFLDRLVAKAGIPRPVRFLSPEGQRVSHLEYRAVKTPEGWLAYVNNLDRKEARQLKLSSDIKFTALRNLTLEADLPFTFTLPAGETWVVRLKQ
ncbi:MAG: beta-galactosidase trimerization domain-containing protein [Tepidisphaerales bacterium]